ncbi:MAG: phage virion morphogenesis protein [Candidatus Competibacteraceae bacterium]
MAGASLDIQLQISNAAEVKAAFEGLQARLADLTPVFQDIGESMLNRTRERFNSQTAPDGTPWKALSPAYALIKKRNVAQILTLYGHLRGTLNYQGWQA